MHPAGEPALLRPLSLGEVFDRAVTLYVRNFVLFSLIALVMVVPLAIIEYVLSLRQSATLAQLLGQIEHPAKTPAPLMSQADSALTFAMVAAAIVLGSFMLVAIAAAIGALYRGERPEWSACYRQALRRFLDVFVALISEAVAFVVVIVAGAFVFGLAFAVAILLVRLSGPLGVLALAAAAVVTLAWALCLLLCYLAFAFAFSALGNERGGSAAAIAGGFARVFNRSELLRAVLVCLALVAIYIGLSTVSLSIAALFEVLHLHVLRVVVNAGISLVTSAFLSVLLAVYYFDVRVRREGLDLQAEIAGLQPAASAP